MRIVLGLLLLFTLSAVEAEAQRRQRPRHDAVRDRGGWSHRGPVEFGIRSGYDFDEGVASAGTQLRIPLVEGLLLTPSADVFFDDAQTQWQINADAVVRPSELGGVYLGAGAAFASRDFDLDRDRDVEAGYNLLLGLDGGQTFHTRVKPFVEARWTRVQGYHPFRLVAGINVPVR